MEHVVSRPTAPFRSSSGRLEVHQIPAWIDNFIYLLVDPDSREAAIVDGPEAGPALSWIREHGLHLTTILNTHTHADHVGINRDLAERGLLGDLTVVGPARRASDVPGITRKVDEGDVVSFAGVDGNVLLTEGHIDGHVTYVFDDIAFCGDTLFAGGCGYLFDGPPAKMFDSLSRLRALPAETLVVCAHEYTQDNLRFAWTVEPDNPALADRIRDVWSRRGRGEATVPSTIGLERATNPFLRWDVPALADRVRAVANQPLPTPADVFAATRALKDHQSYKSLPDAELPVD